MAALERLDAARARQKDEAKSRQSRFTDPMAFFTSTYKWIKQAHHEEPPYERDSRARDKWLREYWRKEPHLAGVVNSVTSIDRNRGWWITSGRNATLRFERILRNAENGQGWRYFMSHAALSFYTSDMGTVVELGRDVEGGPLRALFNVDPVACRLTGNPETPLEYFDVAATKAKAFINAPTGAQAWSPDDFFRVVPLPNNDQTFGGLGFCAESRCLEMAKLMVAIYEHDKEKLGARAPRGLLLLQNIQEHQWVSAMQAREAELTKREQDHYGAVAVIAQLGSEAPDAKLVALSQLPDNFNIETTTNLLMYAYALCFGYDPIEFWPVNAGALGRGRETDIQHRKGTGKGGMEFVKSLQDQIQMQLPDSVLFEFEERDAQGELLDAQVAKAWADVTAVLAGSGVLTVQEAKSYLADKGVIPVEWTEFEEETSVDDDGIERSLKRLREQALESEQVQRAIQKFPQEPIIRRHWPSGRTQVLWRSGADVHARSLFPMPDLREPARAIRRPRVRRQAALYEGEDFEITAADVEAAIAEGGERLGAEFEGLLRAEPASEAN